MIDVQKERLRQMMANAILELWKKETGSLASVYIEATVCITSSCNARMTVIQLSDHFPGLIPEPTSSSSASSCDKSFSVNSPHNGISIMNNRQWNGMAQRSILVKPYYHEMNSLSGGGVEWHSSNKENINKRTRDRCDSEDIMDNNNNQTGIVDAEKEMNCGRAGEREENLEEEEESEDGVEEDSCKTPLERSLNLGPNHSRPGVYLTSFFDGNREKARGKSDKNDSAIQDMSADSLIVDTSFNEDNNYSVVKKRPFQSVLHSKWQPLAGRIQMENGKNHMRVSGDMGEIGVVNLSHNESDLLISPPQNYTEQVRDVIRSRLLNGKQKASPPSAKFVPKNFTVDHHLQSLSPLMSSDDVTPGGNTICRPFDASSCWPIVKRESPSGILLDGRLIQQHFASSASPSPSLSLSLSHKGLLDSMSMHHSLPSSIQKYFGLHGSIDATETKIVQESKKEPDIDDGFSGVAFQCGDKSSSKFESNFDSAINNNGEQKTYKCSYCHKTFLFKSKYHEHLPVHTSARPFQCHMCTRTYKYKYDLRVHLRTHLGIPTKSTICPFCSDKFLTNKLLRHHIKEVHREQQQISEDQCAQSLDNLPCPLSAAT